MQLRREPDERLVVGAETECLVIQPHDGPGVVLPVLVHSPGMNDVKPQEVHGAPAQAAGDLLLTPMQFDTPWDAVFWPDGTGRVQAHVEEGATIGSDWREWSIDDPDPLAWRERFDELAWKTPYSDNWETFDLVDSDPIAFLGTLRDAWPRNGD